MEYSREEYKNKRGNIYTTADGYKYILSKDRESVVYLKCALFRGSCKSTAKLNKLTNMITMKSPHNHGINEYHADIFKLKAKCKTAAKRSTDSLRAVFDETTRFEQSALDITFKSCESLMYRARRETQPKIPKTGLEFSAIIKDCLTFGKFFKESVIIEEHCSTIFYSQNLYEYSTYAHNIYFDGTFRKSPKQFIQLWTIFFEFGRHVLPVIHCLLTCKREEIYIHTLLKIKELIPNLQPLSAMGDWEQAARNAFNIVYPSIKLYGCWFHHNQALWRKITKLGLVTAFHSNSVFKSYIMSVMMLPLLPSEHIAPTFDLLISKFKFYNTVIENAQIEKFRRYYKRQWLTNISPSNLSVFSSKVTTNNGAESYHAKIQTIFKCNHPNIWNFCEALNNLIIDTDADIARIRNGLDISRNKKNSQIIKEQLRESSRVNLINGTYNPIDFINSIQFSFDPKAIDSEYIDDNGSDSTDSENDILITNESCCVCLLPRESTICYRPCSHARVCFRCDELLRESDQLCPICMSVIDERFIIY